MPETLPQSPAGRSSAYDMQFKCEGPAVCVSAGMWRSQVRVYPWLHGPGALVEVLLTDSRWGCSPIRGRLLEDDDNGGLREPGRTRGRGRRVMPTAVSPDQFKQAEGLPSYSVMWPASTGMHSLPPSLPPSLSFASTPGFSSCCSSRSHTQDPTALSLSSSRRPLHPLPSGFVKYTFPMPTVSFGRGCSTKRC